jgi:iron(III) transport system substrate-binding protein
MNVSGGAITKAAKNKNEAIKLLEFLSGDLAQYMYSLVNHEYPVKYGVHFSGIVKSFGTGQEGIKNGVFKQDQRSLYDIGSFRRQAIKLLDEVNFDN